MGAERRAGSVDTQYLRARSAQEPQTGPEAPRPPPAPPPCQGPGLRAVPGPAGGAQVGRLLPEIPVSNTPRPPHADCMPPAGQKTHAASENAPVPVKKCGRGRARNSLGDIRTRCRSPVIRSNWPKLCIYADPREKVKTCRAFVICDAKKEIKKGIRGDFSGSQMEEDTQAVC